MLLAAALAGGCEGAGKADSLYVGADDAGGMSFAAGDDASGTSTLYAHIEENHVAVTIVTLGCSGACADVVAVATGGHPPYTFSWDDGSITPARHVCPASSMNFEVKATDTGITGEFARAAQTVKVALTADVIACLDAGGSQSGPIIVPATADLWLAGQSDGSMLPCGQCYPKGMDVAPTNSPIPVQVSAGSTLTLSVTGATSNIGGVCYGPSPDGGLCAAVLATGAGPANGLSSLQCPLNALVGVFLDADVPSGQPPAALDASGPNNFTTLSPLLRQVFFIGDGLTGTGTGAVQRFVVPPGATRLFLASSDALGTNYNNSGQFTVVVSSL